MTKTTDAIDIATADIALDFAVSYLRVSSKKQMDTARDIDPDGNSIATQRIYVDRKASALNARIIEEFLDPGLSAKSIEKRPDFQRMMEYLREHPEIKYVIVYARSRAFRNYIDAALTKRLLDKLDVKLVSAREDFGDGIYAEMMEAVTDIFNDVQNKLSGEDVRMKMRNKAINGGTIGVAKLGYLNARVDVGGRLVNTIEVDPERAPLVLRAFELYATGEYSMDLLEATMGDLGLTSRRSGKPVTDGTLHKMLSDPYYLGYVVYKGERYEGRHPAIVSPELFHRVQDVLNARSARGQRDRVQTHYLKGGLFCDRCHRAGRHARLIYTEVTNRHGMRYGYFLCRARQEGLCDLPHLSAAMVEQAISDHYRTLQLPADFATEVHRRLEAALGQEQSATQEMHNSLKKRLREIEQQENRLIELAAHDTMPQAKIRVRLLELGEERKRAEAGLNDTSAELQVGAQVLRDALHLVADPHALYRDAPNSARRHLNQTFYERLYLDETTVTDEELSPLFQEINDAMREYVRSNPGTRPRTARRQPRPAETPVRQHEGSPRDAEAPRSTTLTDLLTLADVFSVKGSSKPVMVGDGDRGADRRDLPARCARRAGGRGAGARAGAGRGRRRPDSAGCLAGGADPVPGVPGRPLLPGGLHAHARARTARHRTR
ncbi:recombinase family protein [Nocardia asteroides]|nr:recombinase family protein [Nocardia asteroides]UGT62881.1 recombinase family protein [Nocardia asteroides]